MKPLNEANLNWQGCRFLDPMGRVFEYEGEFYRAVYSHKVKYTQGLFESGIIDRLVENRLLIETQITDLKLTGYGLILWHRRIPFLTVPGEWSREFLRDAALCGIDLNLELLRFGLGTIDFHCANIQQQKGCSPVWIDLGSICPLESIDGGQGALSELLKYYLHPLYLLSEKRNLGRACRLLLADGGIEVGEFHDLTDFSISIQGKDRRVWLENIRKWISNFSFPSTFTHWTDYQKESRIVNFDPSKADTRSRIVHDVIQHRQPKKLIDLSCNAGQFSVMAGRMGAEVFAVDLDEGAIEKLHNLVKNLKETISVTAALRNLAGSQKHIIQADLVLALALSHHLAISQKYPFSHIAKVFSSYSTGALLTEFMPNGLGGTHPIPNPLPADYTLENFQKAFEPYFRRIETIYYPISKDRSYRIFVFCTDRIQIHDREEVTTEKDISIFNPHDKEAHIAIICQHCGKRFNIPNNIDPTCPNCNKDFDFKKFSPSNWNTDLGSTYSRARKTVFEPKKRAGEVVDGNDRLKEMLKQETEISDWLPKTQKLNRMCANTIKVVHLCAHDFGGAGNAAYRLHKGLQSIGVDSTMIALNKGGGDPSVKILPNDYLKSMASCLDDQVYNSPVWNRQEARWQKLLSEYPNRPTGLEMFSDAVSDVKLDRIREIQEADIINLHWVAGTVDWPSAPLGIGDKPIVWTLHDMNPFTGGCHYAGDCKKYLEGCGACPQLGSKVHDDLSHKVWEQKRKTYQGLNIGVVTPSRWLGECASGSKLFSRFPVRVIPYGLPLDTFRPYPKAEIHKILKIPDSVKIILFGAHSVLNERKGFRYLLEALNKIPLKNGHDIAILTFGSLSEDLKIPPKFSIVNLGPIADETHLAMTYSVADVFVLPSLEDNLPNTVIEAMACGVPVVGFDIGGMPDMIEHKQTGYLVKPKDIKGLIEGVDWVISSSEGNTNLSKRCRAKVEEKYALEVQAKSYCELYREIGKDPYFRMESINSKSRMLNQQSEELFHKSSLEGGLNIFSSDKSKTDSEKYLVSAIVSTYNSKRFIRGCLEDLENQTIADRLEIVVVNSGSEQNEDKIVKEFQGRYSNIKYIKTDKRVVCKC